MLAQVVHSPAPMEAPTLPLGVTGAGTTVGAGLNELHVHFVHAGFLQLACGLVDTGQHRPAGRNFQRICVAAGVSDLRHLVCKAVHGLLDGGFVVKGTGAHFAPCGVQRALERACDSVCRGGREVLPCAAGLPRTGVEQVVQGRALFKGCGLEVVVVIDGIFPLHGFGGSLFEQPADGGFALAAVLCQQLDHVLPHRLGLLVAPQLPVGRFGEGTHFADAPGDIL